MAKYICGVSCASFSQNTEKACGDMWRVFMKIEFTCVSTVENSLSSLKVWSITCIQFTASLPVQDIGFCYRKLIWWVWLVTCFVPIFFIFFKRNCVIPFHYSHFQWQVASQCISLKVLYTCRCIERGNAEWPSFKKWNGTSSLRQSLWKVGTVSEAILGQLRDGIEHIWAFPSV